MTCQSATKTSYYVSNWWSNSKARSCQGHRHPGKCGQQRPTTMENHPGFEPRRVQQIPKVVSRRCFFFFVDVLVLNVGGEARKHSWIDGHESWYWYMVSWYNYGHLWYFVDIIWRLRIITPNDHKGIPSTKKCYISLEAILSPVGHRKKKTTITQV